MGMHRSGTSLLTRIINLLGAAVPENLMSAASDNPIGYWESEPVAQFNNDLLKLSGNTWKTYGSMPEFFFDFLKSGTYQDKAKALIEQEFGEKSLIVLKCPRICRLFPFWEYVLTQAGYEVHPILIVRNPAEVYQSLAARALTPSFSSASIVQEEHAALLWLRYVLDSERYTRYAQRYLVQYNELIRDWHYVLNDLISFLSLPLSIKSEAIKNEVNSLLRPEMRRQKVTSEDKLITNNDVFTQVHDVYRMFNNTGNLSSEKLDYLTNQIDIIVAGHIATELDKENHAQVIKQHFDYLNTALERL